MVAGLAGAAIFFVAAYFLHWGGINEEKSNVTLSPSSSAAPQVQPVSSAGLSPAQIFDKYADSAVKIVATFPSDGGRSNPFHPNQSSQAIGSGFVTTSDGYILTNAHVIVNNENGSNAKATKVEIDFRNGKKAEAQIVGYDLTSSDVAVLKIDPQGQDLVPITLGDSDTVVVGEPVVAIGSPFGLYSSSITAGIVSAVNRTVESPETGFVINNAIQTDTAINSGNSGGPLFNTRGEVIGLNEQIATVSGGNEGVGFAVPINTAKRVMDQIIAKGEVEYAWMGIIGQTVDEESAKGLNLTVDKGALISDVSEGGPAQGAGLQKGDVITKIDDKEIKTMEDITDILINQKPGDKVKVTYVRGAETKEIELQLGKRPERP